MATKTAQRSDQEYLQRYASKLSDTTRRAKWIGGPDEHEDHPGQTLATRDHDVIMRWARERGAEPATIEGGKRYEEGRPGVLRFDFPGFGRGGLEHIGWDEWFKTFDDRELVMLFQEHLRNGSDSNFFTFDSPHREEG